MNKISGDLNYRTVLNAKRLASNMYRADEIFEGTSDWPGDFVGRAVLALVSLYSSLEGYEDVRSRILAQLEEIFSKIDHFLNEDGFFGNVFDENLINEQQISGNSWFLRGLIEYYKLTKNDKYLKQINTICDKYLLKISKYYNDYPLTKREFGGVGGHTQMTINGNWRLSTDIGCAFIMIDGMTAVYELNRNKDLKIAIENIIEKFLDLNYVALQCQTHATLSCARGIFRFYQSTNDKKYLDYAIDIFNKYLEFGITYDFSNINWFERKNTWTEPCCVIDSMILTKKLFLETGEKKYLDYFNKIYINSIRTFQRKNGGAGCSTCAIDKKYVLKVFMYEAFFCCTMRLGEGLREISDFAAYKKEDTLYIPGPFDVEYITETDHIIVKNDYYHHNISYKVIKNGTINKISFYHPNKGITIVNIVENEEKEFDSALEFTINDGFVFEGDMLLTIKKHKQPTYFEYNGYNYTRIYNNSLFNEKELLSSAQYVKKI